MLLGGLNPSRPQKNSLSTSQFGEDRSHDAIVHSKYMHLVGAILEQADDTQLMDIMDVEGTTVKEKQKCSPPKSMM